MFLSRTARSSRNDKARFHRFAATPLVVAPGRATAHLGDEMGRLGLNRVQSEMRRFHFVLGFGGFIDIAGDAV